MPISKMPNSLPEKNVVKKGPKKKPLQLKEEQEALTQVDAIQDLKNLEKDVNTKEQKKSLQQMYFSVREHAEKQGDGFGGDSYGHDFILFQLRGYFVQYDLDVDDFEGFLEDIADDYISLTKKNAFKFLRLENIVRRMKENSKNISMRRKQKKNAHSGSKEEDDKSSEKASFSSPHAERQKALVSEVFANLTLPQEMNAQQIARTFFNQFEQVQYCVNYMKDMTEEDKKKLYEFLQRLISLFFEGKFLEIYEVSIDENGNIVIRGKGEGGQMKVLHIQPHMLGNEYFGLLKQHFFTVLHKVLERAQRKKAQGEPIPPFVELIRKKYVQNHMQKSDAQQHAHRADDT